MTDNPGLDVLAAIEAMHNELREMRKEVRQDREVREALESRRRNDAARQAKQRERSVTLQSRDASRENHVTPEASKALVVISEKLEETTTPASRENHATPSRDTAAAREAYSTAYETRHGARPVWNATTNSQMARFVKRIGAEEAPAVAEFYVRHRASFYVQKLHPVGLLLQDAEKLRTEWFTGKTVTATEARQQDATQANIDGWGAHRRKPNGVVGR